MMLAKIEGAYLQILRVVILVAATIALATAVWGVASAVPPLLRWAGITADSDPSGGTLREFIDSEKSLEKARGSEGRDIPFNPADLRFPDINQAAGNIVRYLGDRSRITEDQWGETLQSYANDLSPLSLQYSESVERLTVELSRGTGKPLSEERISELLNWHRFRFEASAQLIIMEEAEANSRFWYTLATTAAAFFSFTMIVFVFLFVRIERNLRPQVQQAISDYEDQSVA